VAIPRSTAGLPRYTFGVKHPLRASHSFDVMRSDKWPRAANEKDRTGSLGVLVVLIIIGSANGGSDPSGSGGAITTPPTMAADPPTDSAQLAATAITPPPAVATNSPSTPAPQVTAKPADDCWNDVKLLDCSWKTDQFLTQATVNARIINHTDSTQMYMVEVGLSNAQGKPVTTATAFSDSLAPGGNVTVTGSTFPDGSMPSMGCGVTNITRVPLSGGDTAPGGLPHLDLPHVGSPHLDLDVPHTHLSHGGHGHN